MTCDTCRHAKPYGKFLVCRHPRALAMQQRTNGCDMGLHVDIVFAHWCRGELGEAK